MGRSSSRTRRSIIPSTSAASSGAGPFQRRRDEATLNANVRTIQAQAHDTPAEAAVLHRDVMALEQAGAVLTTQDNVSFGDAYAAAFSQGTPGAQEQTVLSGELTSILDGNATPAASAAATRLVADAPAFFPAVGSSQANVGTIVTDVRAVVADGVGSPPNPFKVQIG